MEPNNDPSDQIISSPTSNIGEATNLSPTPSKSSKSIIIILITLLILAFSAAGVFAFLYFSSQNTATQSGQGSSQNSPATNPDEKPEINQEAEITDTYILRDLDEKMAILHLTEQTGPTITFKAGVHPEFELYLGGLSERAKVSHIISALEGKARTLTQQEKETIILDSNFSDEDAKYVMGYVNGIDGDIVADKYLDVFGEELIHGAVDASRYCPGYYYNSKVNVYFSNFGCGGTSPYDSYYYKYKYTTDNDHAYIYVSAAVIDNSESTLYCGVPNYPISEADNNMICGNVSNGEFDINDSNYQKFGQYRFVFKKANNGTYYFEKVERL